MILYESIYIDHGFFDPWDSSSVGFFPPWLPLALWLQPSIDKLIRDLPHFRREVVAAVRVIRLQFLFRAEVLVNRQRGGDHVFDSLDLKVIVLDRRTGE